MEYNEEKLKEKAKNMRKNIIKMLAEAKSGHPGGSLSAVDIIVTLFCRYIKRTKENALAPDRDVFILSKGHAVPALYAVLYECGLLEEKELLTLRKYGSKLQGHPDRVKLPYVEASTGSLGQGLSIAQGIALAQKKNGYNSYTYCMVGDGEMNEGQIWEALMSAPKFKLDNLIVFLDYNKGQIDGYVYEVMPLEPLKNKIESFNWNVIEINGHNYAQIIDAVEKAHKNKGKPTFIIAHTIKGKGVTFMEDKIEWHGSAPSVEQAEIALKEIEMTE